MSEKIVNIVDHQKLVEVINSFKWKSKDIRGRVYEVLNNLWNTERPHKSINTEIDFEALQLAFPQFKDVISYYKLQVAVSKKLKRPFSTSPVLLIGDPGLGKTYFASEMARLLEFPYFEISLATATASFVISGGNVQWSDGGPGFIIESIAKSTVANPIILIDELDKASTSKRYDPISPFYSLLEPHSAKRFKDEAIPIEIDLSHVIWIATANEDMNIHAPILSRFKRFDIKQPSSDEMLGVIDSVYTMLVKRSELENLISESLDIRVKEQLSILSPRDVRITLEEAITSALLDERVNVCLNDLPITKQEERRVGFL